MKTETNNSKNKDNEFENIFLDLNTIDKKDKKDKNKKSNKYKKSKKTKKSYK